MQSRVGKSTDIGARENQLVDPRTVLQQVIEPFDGSRVRQRVERLLARALQRLTYATRRLCFTERVVAEQLHGGCRRMISSASWRSRIATPSPTDLAMSQGECHRDAFDHRTCLRRKNMIRLPVFGYLAAPGVLGNEKTNAIAARCTVVPAIKLRYFSGEDCCGRRAEASL